MQILTDLAAVNGLVMNMLDVFNLYHQSGLTVMVRTMCYEPEYCHSLKVN